MQPGIDIIVCNYKTPTDLVRFCESFFEYQPSVPSTLWIMNNDPSKSDRGAAAMFIGQDVREVVSDNIFYSGACNLGAELSSREVIGFFNADTRFEADVLDSCYKALMDNPDWGAVGPLQVGDRGEITHAGIFGTLDQPKHRLWRQRADLHPEVRDVREAVTVSGSAYFTRRQVWEEMAACDVYRDLYPNVNGAFLPTPHYYEETWYSYHMQAHGYKVMYFGEASMVHRWHKASPVGGWAESMMKQSRMMFREMCDFHGIEHD